MRNATVSPILAIALLAFPALSAAQEADADALAKQLSNPVAALISVPFQYNYDETYGDDGYKNTLNIQPVIPISISDNWNMISRTIIPVIYQNDVRPGTDQFGLGDMVPTLFFSPKEPTAGGIIWGLGPAALVPTGTDDLSADTWALGPSGVMLVQKGPWTYGALFNHLVDVGGSRRVDINSTFLQPFLVYAFSGGRSVAVNLESTYDWEASQWTIPMNIQYNKVSKIGKQMVSYQAGVRGWLETPAGGPDWGVRFSLTLLYPK